MTFRFVSQDMAAMREDPSNHNVVTDGRGKYRWTASYDKRNALVRVKRVRDLEAEDEVRKRPHYIDDESNHSLTMNSLYALCDAAVEDL